MKSARWRAGICVLYVVSAGVSAQGWFTGAAYGEATQQDYAIGGPISMADDSDGAYRVFGGYMISPIQGVVASYVDLGTPSYEGSALGGFTDELSADGFDFSYIIGWAPGTQERVSLFGTLGVFTWTQKVTYVDTLGTYKYKDEGTSFSAGLGTEIRLGAGGSSPWGIHIEWQLFKNVGDESNSGHEYDRDMVSLGADYRFGRD
jgi:hypothetical protein